MSIPVNIAEIALTAAEPVEGHAMPEASPVPPVPARKGWRKRHPVAARLLLYGLGVVALGGGAAWAIAYRTESARQALITRLDGIDQSGMLAIDPERALKIVRDDVLPTVSDADVARRARLTEAAALDALRRYDESERAYVAIDAGWPALTPRGAVRVPWANMRVNAGRATQALELLAQPGSTEGWPVEGPDSVATVMARAQAAAKSGTR